MSADDRAGRVVSTTLAAGVGASLFLMLSGLALSAARGVPLPASTLPLAALPAGLASGDPAAWLSAGLAVLLATPAARVAVLAWRFAVRRDWLFLALSCAVLAVLAGSLLLGRA